MTQHPLTTARLVKSVVLSIVIAALLLITIVLPAEYNIDPTGIGKLTGLTQLNDNTVTIELTDGIGGNEDIKVAEIPDYGVPTPLPNPNVFQDQPELYQTQTLQIIIPAGMETEIKLDMLKNKVALYSWQADHNLYVDFHGHDESFGPSFFVRYKEQQEGDHNNGSLVAPFDGEHGWYWLNYNEYDVTVTLTVSGYYNDIIDYGIFN